MMGFISKFKKIYLFFTFFLLFSIFYFPIISAEAYYADIIIDVDSSGFVTIEGVTNYPEMITKNTDIYTSKKQSSWWLNITKNDIFSDFFYVLTLPKGSSINYIKSSGYIKIEEKQGNLIVKGFGENESILILVQYQINKLSEGLNLELDYTIIFLIVIIIISLVILLIYSFLYDNKLKQEPEKIKENITDFEGLNKRQKEIMKLLIDKKIPLTQTDILNELNLPKAAVSRNIHRLELKGLIEKEKIGMSNLIRIKKP
jgi:uncharacterized membrane protein